jgi:hypothetical protein
LNGHGAEPQQLTDTMTLLLDPDIRDWVVVPLFVLIVTAGLLRLAVGSLLISEKTKMPHIAQAASHYLRQTSKLRFASHYFPSETWHARKEHYATLVTDQAKWCEEEQERFSTTVEDDDPMSAMMNPMSMMKGNMVFMVQNMVMMQGIQHFFSGFILLKVPFPLTNGFKMMFQRGLAELPDLDPSYVSSVSWYFLVMYGLQSLFRLVIGEMPLEVLEQEALHQQFGLQVPNPAAKQDTDSATKQLRQEAENLNMFLQDFKSEMDTVEKRLLGSRYPKKKFLQEDDFLVVQQGSKGKKKRN